MKPEVGRKHFDLPLVCLDSKRSFNILIIHVSLLGSGVPARDDVDAELDALSGTVWHPASALR